MPEPVDELIGRIFHGHQPTNREAEELAREYVELRATLLDYFQNDNEGWKRPWKDWRDRAAKAVGLPTSAELAARRSASREGSSPPPSTR